jgi:hypothetical protein
VRERLALFLLFVLPAVALWPAWGEGRLASPGDGAALHFPLRAAVWEAYRHAELPSWNGAVFSGAPLLAGYRAGALYPPMALLALAPPFEAFQVLVIGSLGLAGVLLFVYLRRLGANAVGAYAGGLGYALGPYLLGHLDDSAALVAAPLLPLLLLALEHELDRPSPRRAAGVGVSLALLLLAGSPEAARAGLALAFGRLTVAHLGARPTGTLRLSLLGIGLGLCLAAPQLVPTLLASREAGRSLSGLATDFEPVPGLTGLVLRYVSHTPAGAFALAALPLLVTQTPVRVLGIALVACLGLQYGRGPLAAPGAWGVVFDLALAILGGLSLSAQWQARREPRGARLRAYLLFACLASAAALSVSAAVLGPLPQELAGAVGVLALSMILYFALASHRDPVIAGAWLIPLTASFLLQPHGRGVLNESLPKERLLAGTATSQSIDAAMGAAWQERVLTLARVTPKDEQLDLGFFDFGLPWGRRSANGYDAMVPLRTRLLYDGMSVGGLVPGAFLRRDSARLEAFGVQFVQAPTSALRAAPDSWGLGDVLDMSLGDGPARFLPTPAVVADELRLASSLSESEEVVQGTPIARVSVRLASGRELDPIVLRAGVETAEWAYDRADVRPRMRHERASVLESWPAAGFPGHRYLATLPLRGRYLVDGIRIERLPGPGRLNLSRLGLADSISGRLMPVSLTSGFLSDGARFREVAATPGVRLFELPQSQGAAYVVEGLRLFDDDKAVLDALRSPASLGVDLRREALARRSDAAGFVLPQGARASKGRVVDRTTDRIEVRAAGPGLLVVTEAWDAGWSAEVDGAAAALVRVDQALIGLAIPKGPHRVLLRHRAPGLLAGALLAALGACGVALCVLRRS